MKALEMEEAESFLDSEDSALQDDDDAYTSANSKAKQLQQQIVISQNGRFLVAIGAVVIIALLASGFAPASEKTTAAPSTSSVPLAPVAAPVTAPVAAPVAAPVTAPVAAPVKPLPVDTKTTLLYSHYATIIPDPFLDKTISNTHKKDLTDKYGHWKFWDGDEQNRPHGDYCGAYTNRDIPGLDFPDRAWQGDAVFVNHIIDAAEHLVARAKEAIFVEYGHGKPLAPEKLAERMKMFKWEQKIKDKPPPAFAPGRAGTRDFGGWTYSHDGLVRRLLHAIMTNDEFVVVLAGHSAAAGHGNHFEQSYVHQMHKIMAPVFARLGVKLVTRNMAQGGLGTMQTALGFQDLYGDSIDLILWDSAMTEGDQGFDLFLRQALLSGEKVPVIWSTQGYFNVINSLFQNTGADLGEFGLGTAGVLLTKSEEQVKTLPLTVQYFRCEEGAEDLCANHPRYCATCWLRQDKTAEEVGFVPTLHNVPGQVKWHPGWKEHQLQGRVLAFALLDGLQTALQRWSDGTMGKLT
jgi:hypothetical protein